MERFFRAILERALPEDDDEPELIRRLRRLVRERLPRGTPTSVEVARAMGMSAKTMQRRLLEHHTTYGGELERVRRELAASYLEDSSLSLADVAYLLGYSEPTSFHRAFRRWYGETPARWRAGRRPEGAQNGVFALALSGIDSPWRTAARCKSLSTSIVEGSRICKVRGEVGCSCGGCRA